MLPLSSYASSSSGPFGSAGPSAEAVSDGGASAASSPAGRRGSASPAVPDDAASLAISYSELGPVEDPASSRSPASASGSCWVSPAEEASNWGASSSPAAPDADSNGDGSREAGPPSEPGPCSVRDDGSPRPTKNPFQRSAPSSDRGASPVPPRPAPPRPVPPPVPTGTPAWPHRPMKIHRWRTGRRPSLAQVHCPALQGPLRSRSLRCRSLRCPVVRRLVPQPRRLGPETRRCRRRRCLRCFHQWSGLDETRW
jgi:hypothetical protein